LSGLDVMIVAGEDENPDTNSSCCGLLLTHVSITTNDIPANKARFIMLLAIGLLLLLIGLGTVVFVGGVKEIDIDSSSRSRCSACSDLQPPWLYAVRTRLRFMLIDCIVLSTTTL